MKKRNLKYREDLCEAWAYGHHAAGGPHGPLFAQLDPLQHVFFAKFIERYHPDLVLNPEESQLTAMMQYPVSDRVVDAIEAHIPGDNLSMEVYRAFAHGVAFAHAILNQIDDPDRVLKETKKYLEELFSAAGDTKHAM